jgi:hypothetical protein
MELELGVHVVVDDPDDKESVQVEIGMVAVLIGSVVNIASCEFDSFNRCTLSNFSYNAFWNLWLNMGEIAINRLSIVSNGTSRLF